MYHLHTKLQAMSCNLPKSKVEDSTKFLNTKVIKIAKVIKSLCLVPFRGRAQ